MSVEQVSADVSDELIRLQEAAIAELEKIVCDPLVLSMQKRISELEIERDQYKQQAEINAQTVIRQANEMCTLERLLDVERRAVAAAHDVEERFR